MDTLNIIVGICVTFPFVFGAYLGFSEWTILLPTCFTSMLSFFVSVRLIPSIKHATHKAKDTKGRNQEWIH